MRCQPSVSTNSDDAAARPKDGPSGLGLLPPPESGRLARLRPPSRSFVPSARAARNPRTAPSTASRPGGMRPGVCREVLPSPLQRVSGATLRQPPLRGNHPGARASAAAFVRVLCCRMQACCRRRPLTGGSELASLILHLARASADRLMSGSLRRRARGECVDCPEQAERRMRLTGAPAATPVPWPELVQRRRPGQSEVSVRQSAPATDGDQPRIALLREDRHTRIPAMREATSRSAEWSDASA